MNNNGNNNNEFFHQNSNPSEAEYDYGGFSNIENPNAFEVISTDIYESNFLEFFKLNSNKYLRCY